MFRRNPYILVVLAALSRATIAGSEGPLSKAKQTVREHHKTDAFDRCCRKTILGAKARNIDSRSTTSAQHRINASFDRIRLLPTRDIAKTFSTASTLSGHGGTAYSITSSAQARSNGKNPLGNCEPVCIANKYQSFDDMEAHHSASNQNVNNKAAYQEYWLVSFAF